MGQGLVAADMAPVKVAGTNPALLYPIARGFVGTEAAIAFQDFVKTYERQISAEMVLRGETAANDIIDAEASVKLAVLDKLVTHCTENKWSVKETKAVAKFGKGLGGEFLFQLWTKLSATNQMDNIRAMHKLIGADVVKVVQQSRNLAK